MTGRPLRFRSKKQVALYIQRRKLVASLLEENPWCQIRWDEHCEGRADQVDEKLARSAGGSILDPDNCQTCCGHCHRVKHANPAEALGWTRGWGAAWSWKRLADVAGEMYWHNRPAPAVEDVAA